MKKLFWLLVITIISLPAFANQRYQGVCATSGSTITSGLTSTTTSQLTYPGATVTVNVVGGGIATIFSDNLGTPLANPFTASSSDASFSFYAANTPAARYSVTCSGTGVPTISINPDVVLYDPAVAIPGVFTTGNFSGNVTIGGTLIVTGLTTLNGGLTGGAGTTFDFSAIALMKARVAAGLTTTVNGDFGYDTTNKNWHFFGNAVDNLNVVVPVSVTETNNDCAKWTVAAGVVTLNDNGGPCAATISVVANNFLTGYNATTGAFSQAQPAFSNLSGQITLAQMANLGTTTTVLHGNAAGNPSFSAVSLTADVSGTLPVANGGTGVTTSTGTTNVVLSNSPSISTPTMTSPTINTGVSQGSGHKHQRFGGLCTTAAAAGATCTTPVTWTVAFADANYTVNCTGITQVNTATGPSVESKAGAGFTLRIMAVTATAASFTTVDCIADHD